MIEKSLIMFLIVTSIYASADQVQRPLVENKEPVSAIVIAQKPTLHAQLAAQELRHYIKKITDVELPIISDDKIKEDDYKTLVLVGESELTRKLGLKNQDFEKQEYLIETKGKYLILMGCDEQKFGKCNFYGRLPWPNCTAASPAKVIFENFGSMYAVDSFLEKAFDVRWYLPTEIGEVVPKKKDSLYIPELSIRRKPWTKHRRIIHPMAWKPFHQFGSDSKNYISPREMLLWCLRMKIGGEPFQTLHSTDTYINRFGKSHPEYFANGKVSRPPQSQHLCYTNKDVINQHIQDADDYFNGELKVHSAAGKFFSAMPADSSSFWCECENCKKLMTQSKSIQRMPKKFHTDWASLYVWTFVNKVAKGIREKHPDKWVSCAAYAKYFGFPNDPTFKLEPNIAVQLTKSPFNQHIKENKKYSFDNLKKWKKHTDELYVWDYFLNQQFNNFKSFPWIAPHQVADNVLSLKEVGISGYSIEKPHFNYVWANIVEDMINVYVTYKLLDDTSRSVDGIMDEFYKLFFGPAAPPMKEFCEKAETLWLSKNNKSSNEKSQQALSWEVLCPPETLTEFNALIQKAKKLAIQEPYATRVRLFQEAVYKQMEKNCLQYHSRLQPRKRFYLPEITSPIIIDGILNEPTWAKTPSIGMFESATINDEPLKTTCQLTRDKKNLYVAFKIEGKAAAHSVIDLLIDPARTRTEYFLIRLSPEKVVLTEKNKITIENKTGNIARQKTIIRNDSSWAPQIQYRATVEENVWFAELAIPLSDLGDAPFNDNTAWGLNVRIIFEQDGEKNVLCWNPMFDANIQPNEFGVLTFKPDSDMALSFDFEEEIGRNPIAHDRNGKPTTKAVIKVLNEKWSNEIGKIGNAFSFGKKNQTRHLVLHYPFSTDDFTVDFWVKPDKIGRQTLISGTTSPPCWGIDLTANNSVMFRIQDLNSKTQGIMSKERLEVGKWYHITVTVDRGGNASIFINDHKSGSKSIKNRQDAFKDILTIGGPHSPYQGLMDSLQIRKGIHVQENHETAPVTEHEKDRL